MKSMKKLFLTVCLFIGGIAVSQAQQTSPVWPGCEGSEDVSKCFSQKLSAHVAKHYEYPMEGNEYVRGKVTATFVVNEEGKVVVEKLEGSEPSVNAAAREMLGKIPDMKPGTLNGEPDARSFTVPFNF